MKNKIAILLTLTALLSACGSLKKSTVPEPTVTTGSTTTEADPCKTIIATLEDWQTKQTSGHINLNAGTSFSTSIQMRMVRDKAIYISLRPVLGIEVGKLLITADSLCSGQSA